MVNVFEASETPSTRELADRAERCQSLSAELNAVPFQQRLQLAREIERIVATDQAHNQAIPGLVLETAQDSGGENHLTDIRCITPQGSVDIYNLPGKIDQLDFPQDVKLRQDRAHSWYMKTGGREIYPQS